MATSPALVANTLNSNFAWVTYEAMDWLRYLPYFLFGDVTSDVAMLSENGK